MSLKMGMCLTQKLLPDTPATHSVFKGVNKRLDTLEYQRALKFFGTFKRMNRYVDKVDFLFCECFPKPWKKKCFDYYYKDGCQLIDDADMTPEHISYYDRALCFILDFAVFLRNNPYYRKRDRWAAFMTQVEWVLITQKLKIPLIEE